MKEKLQTKHWLNRRAALNKRYKEYHEKHHKILELMAGRLESLVSHIKINGVVKGRVKAFHEYYRKLLLRNRTKEVKQPFQEITDLLGFRIVAPFIEDMRTIETHIEQQLNIVEIEYKSQTLSPVEFGYDSTHILIQIPDDILETTEYGDSLVAEIQLRTILQEAWAEVEHELAYKSVIDGVDQHIRRKLHALNATLSLADTIFQEIRDHQRKRNKNLKKRNRKLMEKVATLPEQMGMPPPFLPVAGPGQPTKAEGKAEREPESGHKSTENLAEIHIAQNLSTNDLMIQALRCHVEHELDRAVELYNQLIAIRPTGAVYNHRGLAHFALSEYELAVNDFTEAIKLTPGDMRAYTNRGLAYRMIRENEKALVDFNKSLELNNMWADTFYGRALTYYDLGNIGAAMEDCEQAMAIHPEFKQVVRFKKFLQGMSI